MAASDKGQGSQSDQGAKKENADGMADSGKTGGGGTPDTGKPGRTGSDEVAQGMTEFGSGKPTDAGSGSTKR